MPKSFRQRVLDDLTLTQKYIVLLLGANDFQPLRGNLWLQKELFVLSEAFEDLREESDFEPYFLGPHSEFVEDEVDDLIQVGLIEKEKNQPGLTEFGRDIHREISRNIEKKRIETVSDMKDLLNNMTERELLGFIYFSFPEMKEESPRFKEIERDRKRIAMSLLRRGKISVEKASNIAGVSVERLIQESRKRGIQVYG